MANGNPDLQPLRPWVQMTLSAAGGLLVIIAGALFGKVLTELNILRERVDKVHELAIRNQVRITHIAETQKSYKDNYTNFRDDMIRQFLRNEKKANDHR